MAVVLSLQKRNSNSGRFWYCLSPPDEPALSLYDHHKSEETQVIERDLHMQKTYGSGENNDDQVLVF